MAKFALLIGVSEYEPGLNPLPATVKDVEALQRVLLDSEMCGFDQVKQLTNPDPQSMQYEIETLFSSCTKNDLVLLFFSGHGIKDDNGKLYFATRITRKSDRGDLIRSTAVPSSFIHDIMNNSRCKRQVIILDCCFSGAFDLSLQSKDDGSIDLQNQLGAEGRVVLTSSSSTQYSYEQIDAELSIYTHYLIEGIETGAGDLDDDGNISILELHEYASGKVYEIAPGMTPKIITLKDQGFNIVLAKAKVLDPILKYRKEAQKLANEGEISSFRRTYLNTIQNQLGISSETALEIENEVLKPYRKRLDTLQQYRQAFLAAIENGIPVNKITLLELRDLSKILGLRKEDIDPIESDEISKIIQNKGCIFNPFYTISNSQASNNKSLAFKQPWQNLLAIIAVGSLLFYSSIILIKNVVEKHNPPINDSLRTPEISKCKSSADFRELDRQILFVMQKNNSESLVNFLDLNAEMSAQSFSFPLLQPQAKKSLERAILKRMKKLVVNSAYRSITSQKLLSVYADKGKCGVGLAARPGKSNHQTGLAIDIEDSIGWAPYLKAEGWRGDSLDPIHFYFDVLESDTQTLNISKLSIESFQQLWNLNNPSDKISVNGIYDSETDTRLSQSPIEGFPKGEKCTTACGVKSVSVRSVYEN